MNAGKLKITVAYESNSSENAIDVFSNTTGKTYYQGSLPKNRTSFTFQCILPTNINDLEIRSYYGGEGSLAVESISVQYSPWLVGQPLLFFFLFNLILIIFLIEIMLPVTTPCYTKKNTEIELFRFLMCLGIMMLHFSEDYIQTPGPIPGSYVGVDFFFLISGYFIYSHYKKNYQGQSPFIYSLEYTWGKIKALFPAYYFSIIAFILLQFFINNFSLSWLKTHLWANRLQFLGLHFIGTENGAYEMRSHWYISVLLVLTYVISICVALYKEKFVGLCPLLSLTVYVYLYNKCGTIGCQGFNNGIIGGGILRGLAGMAIGISIYELVTYLKKSSMVINPIYINLLKLSSWLLLIYTMIFRGFTSDDFTAVIPMSLLLLLSLLFPSQLLCRGKRITTVIHWCGNLSYPMFLNHLIVSTILSRYFKNYNYYFMMILFITGTIIFSAISQRILRAILKKK